MTDSVPEGQVPRDEKFWNTYTAVQREHREAWTKIECARRGHEIRYARSDMPLMCECGMTPTEIAELITLRLRPLT